jgi:hypothetical protein
MQKFSMSVVAQSGRELFPSSPPADVETSGRKHTERLKSSRRRMEKNLLETLGHMPNAGNVEAWLVFSCVSLAATFWSTISDQLKPEIVKGKFLAS